MNKRIKTFLCLLFMALVMTFAAGSVSGTAYAAEVTEKDENEEIGEVKVYFSQEYASVGQSLTVVCEEDIAEDEELSYVWYVDERKSSCSKTSFEITGDNIEKFIKVQVWCGDEMLGETSIYCSNLPVVYVNTENGAEIVSKEEYIQADMHIQGNRLYNSDSTTLYSGEIEIKGRGNSTWKRFDKKPYKIKLKKSTSLLGLGKNKHWVLLANYIDESLMRNQLATELAKKFGSDGMDGTWVDVVLNGEYIGCYQLCEQVRLSSDRVNVFDWEETAGDIAEAIAEKNGFSEEEADDLAELMETDYGWISSKSVEYDGVKYEVADYYSDIPSSFNGGYLLEMDAEYDELSKFMTSRNVPIMFKSPEYIYTDSQSMGTVQNYIQKFENAIYTKDNCIVDGRNVESYAEMCDIDSLVSFWLVCELMENEVGFKSTYMNRDIGEPLVFGPVWDFDFSSGSVAPFGDQSTSGWITRSGRNWFADAMNEPFAVVKVRELYLEKEEYLKSIVQESGLLEEWYGYLYEAGIKNSSVWPYSRGYEADYEELRTWLAKRITWIDKQFASDEAAMNSLGVTVSDKFDLTLSGDGIINSNGKAYTVSMNEMQTFDLTIDIKEGNYSSLNYYINGRYVGNVKGVDGQEVLEISQNYLTEDIGEKNVISVWLKDSAGNLVEMQYITIDIDADGNNYCNVIYVDKEQSYSKKVKAGSKVYLGTSLASTEDNCFLGWKNVETDSIHEAGKRIIVNSDMTLVAQWHLCVNEGYSHLWNEEEDKLHCENCEAVKDTGKEYIDIASCTFTQSSRYNNKYTGKEVIPHITVTYAGRELQAGVDYEIAVKNNINVGYATYTITGIKTAGFAGKAELSYRIVARTIKSAKITNVSSKYPLTDGIAKVDYVLSYNGITLQEGKDYKIEYVDNTKLGKATAIIKGIGNFNGSISKTFTVVPEGAKNLKAVLYGYDDIKVTWTKSNGAKGYYVYYKKPGSSKFTLIGKTSKLYCQKANLKDGAKYTFMVIPYATVDGKVSQSIESETVSIYTLKKVSSVKASKSSKGYVKISWKNITGESGYQIARSGNRSKDYKVVSTVSYKYSSKKIKDLSGSTYYKVRAYKTVNGKKIYGPWSGVVRY